jgi:hypothetical protein
MDAALAARAPRSGRRALWPRARSQLTRRHPRCPHPTPPHPRPAARRCAKPLGSGSGSVFGSTCTSNFTVLDCAITWGVGVSMGSVPPDVGGNCIANVHVARVHFESPLKAVYVKPNPQKFGQPATGLIANVTYENVTIASPVWWAIWVGTQQQQQPGTSGTGCSFLFPLANTSCPTDPQVTVANLTLRRVAVTGALLSPGVLLANASNPATGFGWDGVVFQHVSTWPVPGGYLCEGVQGVAMGGTFPVPPCFTTAGEEEGEEEEEAEGA